MSLLEVKNLDVAYGRLQVLWNVNIRIENNSIIGIIGPNGAGKSTLLKAIAGSIKPINGEIIYYGRPIEKLSVPDRVKLGIVYVPDGNYGIYGKMTVIENLILGAYLNRENIKERLKFVFELFPPLYERRSQKAETLSGGEKQMLVLGRALMSKPRLLLLDEPSTGLSPMVLNSFYATLEKLISKDNMSVVLVEQNINRCLKLAHYVYLLENGKVKFEGPKILLLKNYDMIKRIYIGS